MLYTKCRRICGEPLLPTQRREQHGSLSCLPPHPAGEQSNGRSRRGMKERCFQRQQSRIWDTLSIQFVQVGFEALLE